MSHSIDVSTWSLEKCRLIESITQDTGWFMQDVSDEFWDDIDVVRTIIQTIGFPTQWRPSERILRDKDTMIFAVSNNHNLYKYISAELTSDKQFVLACIRNSTEALPTCFTNFNSDVDINVAMGMASSRRIAQYAIITADRLKYDKEFMCHPLCSWATNLRYATLKLKDDAGFMLPLVSAYGSCLEFASTRLRADKKFVQSAVVNNGGALLFASDILKDDEDLVMLAVASCGYESADDITQNRTESGDDVVMSSLDTKYVVGTNSGALTTLSVLSPMDFITDRMMACIPERLKTDKDVLTLSARVSSEIIFRATDSIYTVPATRKYKHALGFASDRIKNNLEFAKSVVVYGCNARYVSIRIRADVEFAMALITAGPKIMHSEFGYLSTELLSDKHFMMLAVNICGRVLRYASLDLKNDIDMVSTAVSNCGLALEFASDALKHTKSVVLAAVTQNGHSLNFAANELRGDIAIIFAAIGNHSDAICYAPAAFKGDRNFILDVITRFGCLLCYADFELWHDREIVSAAMWHRHSDLRFASLDIRGDKALVLGVVHQGDISLINVSEALADDFEVVMAAVKYCGSSIQYASAAKRNNLEIVLAAVAQDSRNIKYALIQGAATHKKLICTAMASASHSGQLVPSQDPMYAYFKLTSGDEQDYYDFIEWLKMTGRALYCQRLLKCRSDHTERSFMSGYMMNCVMKFVGVPSADLREVCEAAIQKYRSTYDITHANSW